MNRADIIRNSYVKSGIAAREGQTIRLSRGKAEVIDRAAPRTETTPFMMFWKALNDYRETIGVPAALYGEARDEYQEMHRQFPEPLAQYEANFEKYYTLVIQETEGEPFQPQFGDYNRGVVIAESTAYLEQGYKTRQVWILESGDSQPEIDAMLAKFNAGHANVWK